MKDLALKTAALFDDFCGTPLSQRLERHRNMAPEQALLDLFQWAAVRVPAYRGFLKQRGIDPRLIRDHAAFQTLPLTTKKDYMLAYSLPELCGDGRLDTSEMIAVSSGSTGTPLFWPRALHHELDMAFRFEHVLREGFEADRRSTLVVICFALGTWVGGMYTAQCVRYLAQKGYALTLVTPGNNKNEIYRAVQELGPYYQQVVLAGYPPFLKDVIDAGRMQGVEWSRYSIKLIMAGEVFSEEWRTLVCERVGAPDPRYSTASLYGTADGGVLGNETPLSIAIRRFLAQHPDAVRALFGEARLPTLVQYDPLSRFFEVHDGTLLVSGDNGVPLLRYHIADRGGIFSYDALLQRLRDYGWEKAHAFPEGARGVHALPFVYVFGRADFTVSFYGANLFPENVTVGLEQPGVHEEVTGKFVMEVKDAEDQNKILCIAVELAPGVQSSPVLADKVTAAILAHVQRLNSEFAHYVPPPQQRPRVSLLPFADPGYFPPGVKHRYTRQPQPQT